jgi:uncharacterized protein
LVHLSHLADRFVKDPNEVVTVTQKVQVTVMEVDIPRKRIGLSMKADPFAERGKKQDKPESKPEPKPQESISMQEKLAMLKSQFGR